MQVTESYMDRCTVRYDTHNFVPEAARKAIAEFANDIDRQAEFYNATSGQLPLLPPRIFRNKVIEAQRTGALPGLIVNFSFGVSNDSV